MSVARIAFVLPFYNEAGFITDTLSSLANQTSFDFELILVDNGSTDTSRDEAEAALAEMPTVTARIIDEPRPGKLNALVTGAALADNEFIGTIDADTHYPPSYVERMLSMFDNKPAAVMVIGISVGPDQTIHSVGRLKRVQMMFWPQKCHGGGHSQAFRREALMRAGGFDADRWPYVLEDHEIVARVAAQGSIAYHPRLVCHASDRRTDRSDAHWSLHERLLYKLIPAKFDQWFFHQFLAPRFAKRGLGNIRLRNQSWRAEGNS